jgi:glycerate 2-kinase
MRTSLTVLLAPDSFKGSLTALEACAALEEGVWRAEKRAICLPVPLADGGEGTVAALQHGAGGDLKSVRVRGPLGTPVNAQWLLLPDGSAVLEMAQSSGLTLIENAQRDALRATSYGTGEVIKTALDSGCRHLLIGIGGSATTDGGAGALQALGAKFLDHNGDELSPGGAALRELRYIDLSRLDVRLRECQIEVLCDVNNPLHGPQGAAHVYAPQKGASPADVKLLDDALQNYAAVAAQTIGRDLRNTPGAGAAGGIGFGLLAFLNASLRPGIEVVLEATRFAEKLEIADLVLTGEGAIDGQTLSGKAIYGVCAAARNAKNGSGVPVIAFGGAVKLNGEEFNQLGLLSAFALPDAPLTLEECLANAAELLSTAAERALRVWR